MSRRGLLITAEGLDRSGTGRLLELLARWLERRGRTAEIVPPASSRSVRRAAASRRTRAFLDARVAALLTAVDFERGTEATVRRYLARGSVVLVDRYVWTAIAREVARGLDRGWSRNLYQFARRPDLSIYVRQTPDEALRRTVEDGSGNGILAAASGALRPFLGRVVDEIELLTEGADRDAGAIALRRLVLDGGAPISANGEAAREAVKPLIASSRRSRAGAKAVGGGSGNETTNERGKRAARSSHGERGYLLVLEGLDHAGRSTHADLLARHLREIGRPPVVTSFGESNIAGELIRRAKAERGWDPTAIALLYAADLAERIEHVIRPALRAGLIVIADRYTYTPIARAVARGVDQTWLEGIFAFAPPPDRVVLLDIPPSVAVARSADATIASTTDRDRARFEDYLRFQRRVSSWFADAASPLGFDVVAADREAEPVQRDIRAALGGLLDPEPLLVTLS
ncbi:MAG TPA: dTMP kinase [Candidatus Limnocylindrales bacterium]